MYMNLLLMSTNTAGDVVLLHEAERKKKDLRYNCVSNTMTHTKETIQKVNDYLRTTCS